MGKRGGGGQVTVTLGVLRSPWAVCSLNAGQSPVCEAREGRGGYLMI